MNLVNVTTRQLIDELVQRHSGEVISVGPYQGHELVRKYGTEPIANEPCAAKVVIVLDFSENSQGNAANNGRSKIVRNNLRAGRQKLGLTQEQMADRLGIGVRQYQRIEAGTSLGLIDHWDALEDLLGVHQRILREISDKNPGREENP